MKKHLLFAVPMSLVTTKANMVFYRNSGILMPDGSLIVLDNSTPALEMLARNRQAANHMFITSDMTSLEVTKILREGLLRGEAFEFIKPQPVFTLDVRFGAIYSNYPKQYTFHLVHQQGREPQLKMVNPSSRVTVLGYDEVKKFIASQTEITLGGRKVGGLTTKIDAAIGEWAPLHRILQEFVDRVDTPNSGYINIMEMRRNLDVNIGLPAVSVAAHMHVELDVMLEHLREYYLRKSAGKSNGNITRTTKLNREAIEFVKKTFMHY